MSAEADPVRRLAAQFQVHYTGYLAPDGTPLGELPPAAANRELLRDAYATMVLTRRYDAKALNLQRTGKLGTYGSSLGQEAIGIGVASALTGDDVIFPTYREFSAQLARGVSVEELLLYWGGDERGSNYAVPRQDFPICVPIATHCCHAVGAAYAMRLRGESRAAVCFIGDGATSKGDFYESLNAAGVWRLPVLFVVSNNQWAISVPRARQSAAETLAQKAVAAGIPGAQVDGNDFLAVHTAAAAALEQARAGGGAHLIEALTYRLGDHTTADDASRYRDPAEVEAHRAADPLPRLRAFLAARGWWSDDDETALVADVDRRIEEAVAAYQAATPQPPESMFDYLYETLPEALEAQRDAVREGAGRD